MQISLLQLGLKGLLEKISDLALGRGAANIQGESWDLAGAAFGAQKGCSDLRAIAMREDDFVTGTDQAYDLGGGALSIGALFGNGSRFSRANQGVSADGQ